jgi:hypothetical protein
VSPLAAGDTVTLKLNQGPAEWMHMRVHDVTGLTVGNPIGQQPPANYISIATGSHTTPIVINGAFGAPTWKQAVIINTCIRFPPFATLDAMLARGLSFYTQPLNFLEPPNHFYTQLPLPELHLIQGDTITVESMDENGLLRLGDTISDYLIWGVDE